MSLLQPYTYQAEAIAALYDYFEEHDEGHPIIEAPTASGKSVIIAHFIAGTRAAWPDQRVLMLTHRKELIEQNEERLLQAWPEAPVGIYSAGVGRKELDRPILFAGIQSLARAETLPWFDIVIIDENHLVPWFDKPSQYRDVLQRLQAMNPNLRIIGLSATPYRTDGGYLHEGKHRLFTDICHRIPMDELIDQGRLCKLRPFGSEIKVDLSKVRTRNGDFVESDMAEAFSPHDQAIVREIVERGQDRKKWLLFCSNVEHCYQVKSLLGVEGISAEVLTGETPKREREDIIARFRRGEFRALVNCMVLTTGFDVQDIDLLAILRATKSTILYVQIMGRGMRVFPGKEDCLVLDYGQNVARHGPINKIKPRKPGTGESGSAPAKQCPTCDAVIAAGFRECPECGHLFEQASAWEKLTRESSQHDIIARLKPHWIPVRSVGYRPWVSKAGRNSVRVDYQGQLTSFAEWISVEHTGYARTKATGWWIQRMDVPMPATVNEALQLLHVSTPRVPKAIRVIPDGKYHKIIGYDWTGDALNAQQRREEASAERTGDAARTAQAA